MRATRAARMPPMLSRRTARPLTRDAPQCWWGPINVFNLTVVPLHLRVLTTSLGQMLWTAFLSHAAH